MAQSINVSASLCCGETCIFSQYLAKAYQTCHCNLFFSVLWTHCLAKSLWGSLNRLCFPSGESIQVTDTESWLESKWPLQSWKYRLIWHLTNSDVAADYKAQLSSLALSCLPICFLHHSRWKWEEKHQGRCKYGSLGMLWVLHKHDRGQAADELCPKYKSSMMLLPVFASLFTLSHSSGPTRLFCISSVNLRDADVVFGWLLKTDGGSLRLCLYKSCAVFKRLLILTEMSQRGHSHSNPTS